MHTTLHSESSFDAPFEQNRSVGYSTLSQSWWLIGVFFLAQIPASFPMLGLKAAADAFNLPVINTIGQTLAYVISLAITIWYGLRKRGSRILSFAPAPVVAYLVVGIDRTDK